MAQADRGVPLSTLCPKFLHTNSTSHTWPFSAIAELVDNAYDPDVSAKHFWIDYTVVRGQECLTFMDDGNGLDYETMHKMLSFGYSDKTAVNGKEPIGIYGNGFKSGSMRLGRDAIVFSKSRSTSCVGMLSQSYHEAIGAKQIVVPIVCFERRDPGEIRVREEHRASLQDLLSFSPFSTQEELLAEVDVIGSSWSEGTTGTRIIVWSLRRTSTGKTEFDFEKDRYDIQIPSDILEGMSEPSAHQGALQPSPPPSTYSLRAYCSILYLKPRLQVIIRGQKVRSQLVAKTLAYVRKDRYKPATLKKAVPITFGYNTKSKDQYGVMMYHKNRLIKAYQRVGCQLKANYKGVGVIGVIECNFLDPTHNKQSFMETDKYRNMMNSLGIKLEEYWEEIRHKRKTEDPNCLPVEDAVKRPDQNWTQCDSCSKWRKLPDGIDTNKLPERWFCHMNPDPQFRSCQVEEEPEDSDDEQTRYPKVYKQKQREEKKNQERKRQKEEEERKRQEEQRLAELTQQNQVLKRQHEKLQRQLRQKPARPPSAPSAPSTPSTTPSTPSTPTTPRSRFNTRSPRGSPAGAESCTASQAACSPPSNSGLPVISSVCSLSAGPPRGKRPQPTTPQTTPKRPRPPSPAAPPPPFEDSDDTDDDLSILETASTPKPPKPPKPPSPACDLTKVKTEPIDFHDDAAMDVSAATVSAGTAPPAPVTSITTQTEAPTVKKEADIKQEMSQGGGATPWPDGGDGAGSSSGESRHSPSLLPSVKEVQEVQEQQDQLVELMQATAQERDSFKEQVQELRRRLQEAQSRLQEAQGRLQEAQSRLQEAQSRPQEAPQVSVKTASSSRAVQTDPEKDYRSLLERARQNVDELMRAKEVSMATAETKPGEGGDEDEGDSITLQVDRLLRELDRSNKEKEELRSQLDGVEEERANLASQCEELRMSLQQRPDGNRSCCVQTDLQEAGESASLVELRHNIGRLLVSFVPALDLSQVNYECNVIDEILEQVLSGEDSFTPGGLPDRAINR